MFQNLRLFIVLLLLSGSLISCVNTNKVITDTAKSPILYVNGLVVNQETSEPIPDVDVWVEETTIHAKTNEEGKYKFQVPRGYYTIVAHGNNQSFTNNFKELHLESNMWSDQMVNFELEEKPGVGGRNFDYESEARERAVETFQKHYINDEMYEDGGLNCSLQNTEDLLFSDTEDGVLNVGGPVELLVQNRDLGYNITVLLEDYISKDYGEILGIEADADYLFEEMTPENQEQAQMWEKNRQEYFKGSFRHFLIAMVSDKSPLTFGYRIFLGQSVTNTSAMAYTQTSVNDIEAEKNSFILPPLTNNGSHILRFEDELRVENVERGVSDPHNIMGLDDYLHETSWVSLVSPSAEFSKNGLIKDDENVSLRGVWRYTPVCKMIPKDFLPNAE